jgi:hypothetical protein
MSAAPEAERPRVATPAASLPPEQREETARAGQRASAAEPD